MKITKISASDTGWSVEVNSVNAAGERTHQGFATLHMTKEEAVALEIGQVLTWEMVLVAKKIEVGVAA